MKRTIINDHLVPAARWSKGAIMRLRLAYRAIAVGLSSAMTLLPSPPGRCGESTRRLSFEPLEPRLALSALGLVETPYQPSGGLDGKIVYLHAGHGYTADSSGNWSFQRGEGFELIEDLGNYDQATLLADYLFRAGATIAPLRPIGHQANEVVLDNDDDRVTFQGTWTDSTSNVYFGSPGDLPYRFAPTSTTETAVARYQPDLPEAGFYPVYSWAKSGGNRATDQLYRVHHAGGETEVTVNHRRVGDGLVYLGTYYFEQGTEGYVEISNQSSETGSFVIADMIRFGNGIGDIDRGAGISGRSREDEAGLYWIQWHVDRSQGISESEYRATSDDRNATIRSAPKYAEFMNREADGQLSDRVFVSFHSNALNGAARGVIGLWNSGGSNTATPNQFLLAQTLAAEVNDDLLAQNGDFEHAWANRSTHTLGSSFGEIDNREIGGEFDATIVETGFHDNQLDAEMLRDPRVRDAIARATYQGLIKYFRSVDGNQTSATVAPAPVAGVWAASDAAGSVTVHWNTPEISAAAGSAASGYRIFASTGGYSFDGGTVVAGGGATSHTFTGLDPLQTYYFQIVAENAGGASAGSQVMAAKPIAAEQSILIVNGFDRLDRFLDPTDPFGGGGNTVDRVRPRDSNSGDYLITVAGAIQREASTVAIASASNESVIAGDVSLADYDAVIWMLGEESTDNSTFDTDEQDLVEQYIAGGGNLFASGAEIGWDLDNLNNGRSFFRNTLGATYAADDANTYTASGSAGGIFAGLNLSFDSGQQFYNVDFADVLTPGAGATTIATYATGGGAATQKLGTGGRGDVLLLGFPVESILSTAARDAVISRVLDSFGLPTIAGLTLVPSIDNGNPQPAFSIGGNWTTVSSGLAEGGNYLVANTAGGESTATWQFDLTNYGQAELQVRWVSNSTRAENALYRVDTGFGEEQFFANQTVDSGQWVTLGSFPVAAGLREVSLSTLDASGGATLAADAVRLVLTSSASASGDFNGDAVVDAADYTTWRDSLGATVVRGAAADGNGDARVDTLDYQLWKSQFGTSAPAAGSLAASVGNDSVDSQSLMLAGLNTRTTANNQRATPSLAMFQLESDPARKTAVDSLLRELAFAGWRPIESEDDQEFIGTLVASQRDPVESQLVASLVMERINVTESDFVGP